jgi:homocysteine S-methyltransferase
VVFAPPHDTVLITDGGLATELEVRGHDLSDDLWSARLLVDAPEEIVAVHCAFLPRGSLDRHDGELPSVLRRVR